MTITKIIVITDVGEEIDDEVTLWYLDKVFALRTDVKIDVLFVGGHMKSSERLKRAIELNLKAKKKAKLLQLFTIPINPKCKPTHYHFTNWSS